MFAEAASPFGPLVGFMFSPIFASPAGPMRSGSATSPRCLSFVLLTAKPSPLSTPAPRTPQREAMLRLRRRIHRAAAAGPKCHSASRVPAPGDEFDAETDAAEACPSAHAEYVCHDAPQRRAPDHAGPGIPQRRSSAYPHLL